VAGDPVENEVRRLLRSAGFEVKSVSFMDRWDDEFAALRIYNERQEERLQQVLELSKGMLKINRREGEWVYVEPVRSEVTA
jgi:hypothetical protein